MAVALFTVPAVAVVPVGLAKRACIVYVAPADVTVTRALAVPEDSAVQLEPTGHIHPTEAEELLSAVNQFNDNFGLT